MNKELEFLKELQATLQKAKEINDEYNEYVFDNKINDTTAFENTADIDKILTSIENRISIITKSIDKNKD